MKFLILFSILIATSLAHSKDKMCKNLFHVDDRVSLSILPFQSGKQDTTSLRQEVKFVIKTEVLKKYLDLLETTFGERFKNRDKAPEGFANITSTRYMTVAKYIQNAKKLSAKVRFRKYYTRDLKDENWERLVVAKELADKSWLELKIQHPEYDNVVIKPRLLIYDKDIQFLITERYFDRKEAILNRLKELNPGKEKDIAQFANFFFALYTTPSMRVENLFAKTDYERVSYSIKLFRKDVPDDKIDIQITLDENVHLRRLVDQRDYSEAYGKDETVVEVKVPVSFAGFTEANLQAIPELSEIKKFIEWLDQNHVPKYPKNKGKMSKIDKNVPYEDRNNRDNDD